MKKNNLIFIILAIINFISTILLIIFAVPTTIPIFYDLNENIFLKSSKWFSLILTIIPTIFILIITLSKNKKTQFLFKMLFIWAIFNNILYFSYFCLSSNLEIGVLSEVPISVSIFMPFSIFFLILSIKIKSIPYKSKLGINFKTTRETEFIWKQTHFYARDVYFLTSFLMFIESVIFCFIRVPIIEFFIFILELILSTLIIYIYSKSIYKKYLDMKTKKDKLKIKEKTQKEE